MGSFIAPESPRYVGPSHPLIRPGLLVAIRSDIRYLIDTDQEVEGLAVIADFQGKELDHEDVQLEYKEIRDAVLLDVGPARLSDKKLEAHTKRAVGDRSYTALWRRYKARVMIAMSSQMFAQLVSWSVVIYVCV